MVRNILIGVSLLAGMCGFASAEEADDRLAVSATWIQVNYAEPGFSFTNGLMGVKLSRSSGWFGGELVAAGSVNNATFIVNSSLVTAEVESLYGAYAKIQSDTPLSFYVKGGYASGSLLATSAVGFARQIGGDFSYGVGIEGKIGKDGFFQLDFTQYYDDGIQSVDGFALAGGVYF
ncbi:MAG: hypothetical protein P8N58_03850 [Emcibacteraceae bacterium]|nr:hypothetical protein [Emcibacteraceae bacterium]